MRESATSPKKTECRSFALPLALAILFIGLSQILVLPPFEGIDEQGHYSSIRQMADTGAMPLEGSSRLSPDVIDYRKHAPMPLDQSFGQNTIGYAQFFAAPDMQKDFLDKYRADRPRMPYAVETDLTNWEAQHPPLYYLLMVPFLRLTDALPFVPQFFLLRCVSFAMACGGLMLGLWGALKYGDGKLAPRFVTAGYLLLPLILPMFYPEFGRLGNDAAVILLFGAMWFFMLRWMRDPSDYAQAKRIGLYGGLGLLAKASFLPILFGFGLYVLQLARRDRKKFFAPGRVRSLIWIGVLAVLLAGWWYGFQKLYSGSFTGNIDLIMVNHKGGLLLNLQKYFTLALGLQAMNIILTTWSWYGTLSSAFIGTYLHAPVFCLVLWIFYNYARGLKSSPLTANIWLPVWFCAPFVAGLYYQSMVELAKTGTEDEMTAGWYLHVMAPAYGLAVAYGLQRIWKSRMQRIILFGLLAYDACFLAIVSWAQMSLFAGCAVKNAETSLYQFPDNAFCLDRLPRIMTNLGVIGWPYAAMLTLIAGLLCTVLGLARMRQVRE